MSSARRTSEISRVHVGSPVACCEVKLDDPGMNYISGGHASLVGRLACAGRRLQRILQGAGQDDEVIDRDGWFTPGTSLSAGV